MSLPYTLQYTAAWIVTVVGIIAGILATSIAAPNHPSWLTSDVAATAALVSLICISLAALLPQIHRSPSVRESAYLSAAVGVLPPDLAKDHPEVLGVPVTPPQPPPV